MGYVMTGDTVTATVQVRSLLNCKAQQEFCEETQTVSSQILSQCVNNQNPGFNGLEGGWCDTLWAALIVPLVASGDTELHQCSKINSATLQTMDLTGLRINFPNANAVV